MAILTRWLASTALAAGLGMATLAVPAPARADDDLVRVIVDVADVIFRSGYPYYRYGDYGRYDRLTVERNRYGRPVYYRYAPRDYYRNGPPYGKAHGYWKKQSQSRLSCDRYGRCVTRYYDPRYDRRGYDNRYYSYDRRYDRYDRYDRDDRYWDGRRWRDRDDD
ncbi:hypothetical protein [Lysobacter solisilvae (ex Woo and Kim 2020)]|uniref:DUF4148 domain-containing protein n=1 Tax=Agrilutibacter terrestris TaxID=2865112 RepID=A0A7H0FZN2_9GAMM|nr:hypothetical protein [Lysobacter terrestris]QNP41498.1 hypothetical protein H8B22_04585 [Lysobacter terrestris]